MILERDIGLEISRATLDGWVLKVGELLVPMVAAMRRELITGTYIQADETPVDVQTREGRGKNHQAYLWQYSRPGGTVVFDFRLGRGRDGPKRFLGQFEGILQTDGYAGLVSICGATGSGQARSQLPSRGSDSGSCVRFIEVNMTVQDPSMASAPAAWRNVWAFLFDAFLFGALGCTTHVSRVAVNGW
jgi:hypothetical protein